TNADTLELVLAQSFDSGESWKYLWMPKGTQDINFFDKNLALTFRFQKNEFNDVFNFFVNGSTDGGESWKQIYYDFFASLPEYSFDFIDFSFGMICFNNKAGILNITQGFEIFNSLYPVGLFSLYNYGYQKIILPDTLTAFATSIFFGRVFKYEPSLSDIRIEPGESRYSSNAIKFIDNDIINLVDGISESEIKIKIYDIRGVLMEESSAKQIDISHFAVGSYFMILYNGEKYFYDKFIK
ncbi:MAG: T9SS type A sorting domain-containing protein, partial [Candidatus Kapabacteria bacterium]|nr:T9SS type A sorting domain-containing protein [Candidatus Kapabacteria bacterium]